MTPADGQKTRLREQRNDARRKLATVEARIKELEGQNERLRAVVEAAQFASDYFKAHGDSYREASWLIDIRSALAALDSEVTA
jgi:hypothetical protein